MGRKGKRGISIEGAQRVATAWLSGKYPTCQTAVSAGLGRAVENRNAFRYRRLTEELLDISLPSLRPQNIVHSHAHEEALRFDWEKPFTTVAVTDCHYSASRRWAAHDIACQIIQEVRPRLLVVGGDALNAGQISSWPREGWIDKEELVDEYDATRMYTDELADAGPRGMLKKWLIGNHDFRVEKQLSQRVPDFEGMPGTTLDELFPRWGLWMELMGQ